MNERVEIQNSLTNKLVELFELEADEIQLDSRLYEDLDLDSIDAVDLLSQLKQDTGMVVDPERAKTIRTVGDVVDMLVELDI